MNLSTEQKQTHSHGQQNVVAKGEGEGGGGRGMDWESVISRCKLWHLEWISNEVLLYGTGNYIQSLVMMEDSMRKRIYINNPGFISCTGEIDKTL